MLFGLRLNNFFLFDVIIDEPIYIFIFCFLIEKYSQNIQTTVYSMLKMCCIIRILILNNMLLIRHLHTVDDQDEEHVCPPVERALRAF